MVSNFHLPPAGFGPGSQPDPADGEDLTVTAVAQGRDAAESIHAALTA